MNPPPVPVVSSSEFKDRKTGLVVFGILTVLLGVVSALMVLLLVIGQAMVAKTGAAPMPGGLLPGFLFYGGLAVALVWLGIGSMMARRWARALLLIFSWNWLIIGVFAVSMMAFLLPKIMAAPIPTQAGQPEIPPAVHTAMMVVTLLIMSVILIVAPIGWLVFYRSKNVKATCEAYDPVTRWTDRCPLPVLAVSLWLAFSSITFLMMPVSYHGLLPFFGTFVVGPVGMAVYLLFSIIWGYASRAFYRLDQRGWWLVVVTLVLFAISSVITYTRHDIMEAYPLLGYSEAQIAQIQRTGVNGAITVWMSLALFFPMLGYLIYVRRFFPARQT